MPPCGIRNYIALWEWNDETGSRRSRCDQSPTRQAHFAEASKAENRFGDGALELPDNSGYPPESGDSLRLQHDLRSE